MTHNNNVTSSSPQTPLGEKSTSASTRGNQSKGSVRRSQKAPAKLNVQEDPQLLAQVTQDLQTVLDGSFPEARAIMRDTLSDPDMLPRVDLNLEDSRAYITDKLPAILESGLPQDSFRKDQGGTGETGRCLTSIEMLGHVDLSLMVKSGVQWGLWGGAVGNLGTERHKQLVEDLINLKALGCFAMTERGHGSDVQSLETTAHYDPDTQEFIINSPTWSAEKAYIGNAARDGRFAAVFCQLFTPGVEESHGVHCIVVRIREDDGSAVEGVRIGDHGYKGGLKGVDNGTLFFENVRVPRENLLNRFGDVDEQGNYSSPIENPNRRFFTMLGALVRGRVTVGAAAGAAARSALAIGVTYANRRRQFAPDDSLPETRLIEYRQHRLRLIPRVARAYALQLATNHLIARIHELEQLGLDPATADKEQQSNQREVEAHAAALKVANTAHATDTIQEMREACGGAGYMAENLLTTFKADSDVFTTFEGDNVVMLQLAAKELMTGFAKELSSMSNLEMVRFGLDNFSSLLRRRTAADKIVQNLMDTFSDSEETSLFDPATQVKLLTEREDRLMLSLARRLRAAKKAPVDEAAKIVDRAQDHLLTVAQAHIDRILFEALLEAESNLDTEEATEVFEQVRDVYFMDLVVRNAAWYLEQGMLSAQRTKQARASLNDLVDSLGPWSQVLVDAFGVPAPVLDLNLQQTDENAVPRWKSHPAQGQEQ
ncbi:acyl-CoA oxidase [Corynebacterium sp. 320]|uniref:Acyl-CoA oxidase n=1 Tax=Corynebacterium zhongnanshanii TaxID=2768834 RepID=A0ABQ6VFS4_9CORY|nr:MULTISPECIES: acyl-CoA dehydrogenase family protein [Corynebacterium]KAB1504483.1 acyl-CoA oxidase [Corynebacterium sp. 320]KAB1552419.1 acyl-CoA oxidase [Corynebacterium sp. 321]KAB1554367.1 acyl-CoA oxidase [Corynebacterium sp. 319]KAB3522663.1 acyl-CoA oxidase [Corynebacterium zhongnanshanii]KAB3528619.1 acyl-CoA oxidase [Corynebacterium sp. 250]